jgi:hypothetical protein
VCVSGYTSEARDSVGELCHLLGIKYAQPLTRASAMSGYTSEARDSVGELSGLRRATTQPARD